MYSIFSAKVKNQKYLEEGEPPPKKEFTEKDILVKKLSEQQLKTSTSLTEELSKRKEFISNESFSNITSYVSGKTDLGDFQTKLTILDEENYLRSKDLTDRDIELYREYKRLGLEFWEKYKNVNRDVLQKQIKHIEEFVNKEEYLVNSEQKRKYSNSQLVNDANVEEQNKEYLPSAMDEMPCYEKQFMSDILEYSSCDIKKIRKKARSLGNQIKNLKKTDTLNIQTECKQKSKARADQRQTLWDVKEKPQYLERKVEVINKDKVYTCKPENWYTIKNGQIIKLDKNKSIPLKSDSEKNLVGKSKLTLEEIKQIPKFSNYEKGKLSKVLFVKNMGKNVTESMLKNILKQFDEHLYSIKMMNGKMKGQAFIEFQGEVVSSDALELLNGLLLDGKPIIVQFGRKQIT